MRLGREPVLSELSAETGLTPEEIAVAELAAAPPDSLQQENADGLTLESTLASAATEEQRPPLCRYSSVSITKLASTFSVNSQSSR